jgi:cell division protein FtsL
MRYIFSAIITAFFICISVFCISVVIVDNYKKRESIKKEGFEIEKRRLEIEIKFLEVELNHCKSKNK